MAKQKQLSMIMQVIIGNKYCIFLHIEAIKKKQQHSNISEDICKNRLTRARSSFRELSTDLS